MSKIKKTMQKAKGKYQEKKRNAQLLKNANVQTVLNIREFGDGYIKTTNDVIYFIGEYPKNERLMTSKEKKQQKKQLAGLYNNFSKITKFSTDLPYSLLQNKKFLESNKSNDKQKNEVLDKMEETLDTLEQKNENSIKRFYYIFRQSDAVNIELVKSHFADSNVKYFVPSKEELEQMFRSYILLDDNTHDVMYYGFDDYIDTFLPAQIKPYQDILFIGGKYRKVIFAKNFPNPLTEFYLARLSVFKNVNTMIKAYEKPSNIMVDEIVKTKQKNTMLLYEGSIRTKMKAKYDNKNTEGLFDYMQDTNQKMWDVSLFVEIVADTRAEVEKREVEVYAALKSITTESLNNNTMALFQSASPLHDLPLKFIKRNMPTESLACLQTANYSGLLKPQGIWLGVDESGGLIFMDIYERSETITNGHYLIVADSGQGKSYLAKKILYQNYAIGFDIVSFDSEREYTDLTAYFNGLNVDVLQSEYIINPLEIKLFGDFSNDRYTKDEQQMYNNYKTFNSRNFIQQHIGWLRDFFRLYDDELTNEHLNILEILLTLFYHECGVTDQVNFQKYKSEDYPTFSEFYDFLLKVEEKSKLNERLASAIPKAKLDKLILSVHVLAKGSLAPLFNGHTKIKKAKWLNFVIQDLLEKSKIQKDLFFFNVLGFVWSEQVKSKNKTILFTDELYLVINKNNSIVVDYYRMFVKRGRKVELYMGTATQNLVDFADPKIVNLTQPLFSIPKYKFVGFTGENELILLKSMLNLTEGEIDTISVSQQKHFLMLAGKEKYKLVVAGAPEKNSQAEDKYNLVYERDLFGSAGGRGVGE